MPETGDLRVSEAVALAHALVARLADLEGIRVLFVKGPTAVALGARPPRPSSDVDVLCEPHSIGPLTLALEACGWRRRVPESVTSRFQYASPYMFEHSVHYIHDEWPCDLDIHYNFPGFLAPDTQVFGALWERRTVVTVAAVPVTSADRLGQIAIVGLHALRDAALRSHEVDLDHLVGLLTALPEPDRAAMTRLAAETGASEPLRPLLESAGVAVSPGNWTDEEALRRWRARTENAGTYTMNWLIELRATPWRRKPRLALHALFLSKDELMSSHVGESGGWLNLTRLQARRWLRAGHYWRRGLAAARKSGTGPG